MSNLTWEGPGFLHGSSQQLRNLQEIDLVGSFDIGTVCHFLINAPKLKWAHFQMRDPKPPTENLQGPIPISSALKSLRFTTELGYGDTLRFPKHLVLEAKVLEELIVKGPYRGIATSFEHLKRLKKLRLDSCKDLSNLPVPPGLEELDLTVNNIIQESTINKMKYLKVLKVSYRAEVSRTVPAGLMKVLSNVESSLQEIVLRVWGQEDEETLGELREDVNHWLGGDEGPKRSVRSVKRLCINIYQDIGNLVFRKLPSTFPELEELVLLSNCKRSRRERSVRRSRHCRI